MKKVELRMNEQHKYEIIKQLIDHQGNIRRAAKHIDCSEGHIYYLKNQYLKQGKISFQHGNRGRKPSTTLKDEMKNQIIALYQEHYYDTNFKHFNELLKENHTIDVSYYTVHSILSCAGILSPKCNRLTRRNHKKARQLVSTASVETVPEPRVAYLVDLPDAHPRKPRKAYFGELLQMDASQHRWFDRTKTYLHVAIDDATGWILGAYFDTQETLKAYYNVLSQVLSNYGVPYEILTDNRTIFNYKHEKNPNVENDTFTQFGFACKQLGIILNTTSVPQAKGRVERLFGTLQGRLLCLLRQEGVKTVDQANEFLTSYIEIFNHSFGLQFNHTKSIFEKQVESTVIDYALSIIAPRVIDHGSSIRYLNKYYRLTSTDGELLALVPKTKCFVLETFSKKLIAWINEEIYLLQELPSHEDEKYAKSDVDKKEFKKKGHTPPMDHPWKAPSFEYYLKQVKKLYQDNANV
jgi:transposase